MESRVTAKQLAKSFIDFFFWDPQHSPGNPPGIWIVGKFLFKFPPHRAEKLFKCPHPWEYYQGMAKGGGVGRVVEALIWLVHYCKCTMQPCIGGGRGGGNWQVKPTKFRIGKGGGGSSRTSFIRSLKPRNLATRPSSISRSHCWSLSILVDISMLLLHIVLQSQFSFENTEITFS